MKRNHSDSVIGRDLLYTFFYSNRQHSLTVLPQEDYNFTTDLICFQYQNQKRSFGITKGGKGEGVTKKFSSDVNLYLCSLRLCPSKLQADYKVKKKKWENKLRIILIKAFFVYSIKDIFKMSGSFWTSERENTISCSNNRVKPNVILSYQWLEYSNLQTQGSNQLRYDFQYRAPWKHEAIIT